MDVSLATSPGSANRPNEDFAAATSTVAVVLDGVTQRSGLGTGCIHDAAWYVAQLGTRLLAHAALRPDDSLADALAVSIEAVAALHSATCDLTHPGSPAAAVAVLRERDSTIDYLVLADCVLLADGPGGLHLISDDRVEHIAQDQKQAAEQEPTGSLAHSRLMRQLVTERQQHRNQPGGYWVAAADPQAVRHALDGTWTKNDIQRVAILTDGASRLVDQFALADWPELLRQLQASSPASIIRQVREAENSDPDGSRWPRHKRSDDATALFCQLTTCAKAAAE
jgi:hypothetical protein